MPPSGSVEPVGGAEPWVITAMRKNLFEGIEKQNPFKVLQHFADICWGSGGAAKTLLEFAELDLYMKIKSKADYAQLQRQMEKVLELEKKEKEDEKKKTNKKTPRDQLSSESQELEPSIKRARTTRKAVTDVNTMDEKTPVAAISRRRAIPNLEDESKTTKHTQQTHSYEARDIELGRQLAEEFNANSKRMRPKVDSSKDDSVAPPQITNKKLAMTGRKDARPSRDVAENDELGYDEDNLGPVTKARRDEAELKHRVEHMKKKRHPTSCQSSSSTTDYMRKKSNASKRNAKPNMKDGIFGFDDEDDHELANSPDDDLPRNSARPPVRRATIHNQRTPGPSNIRRGSKDSHTSRGLMPPPRAAIRRDPHESSAIAYRRAEATVRARHGRSSSPDSPRLPPVRAPRGRPSQDYDAPQDDESYVPPRESQAEKPKYKSMKGKRYRVVKGIPKIQLDDGRYIDGEVEEETLCLSDAPVGCDSPPAYPTNNKVREIWDDNWNKKPDTAPVGAELFAIPVSEVVNRRATSTLELARRGGIDEGVGSEYIHGERRVVVPASKGKRSKGPGSFMAVPSEFGGSVMPEGSVMGPPPSTIATTSMRYSVRKGEMVKTIERGIQRSINRITPVSSMGVNRDTGIERTIWGRLGRNPDGTPIEEDGPANFSCRASASHSQDQVATGGLTLTNVARLERETGQPSNWRDLVRGKERAAVPGDDDRMTWMGDAAPRAAREDSVVVEGSLYVGTVVRDKAEELVSQTIRIREEVDARQPTTEGEVVEVNDQFRPMGADEEMDEQTRLINVELSREEQGRRLETQQGLDSLFAGSNSGLQLDAWPANDAASLAAESSISRRASQRAELHHAQHSRGCRRGMPAARRADPYGIGGTLHHLRKDNTTNDLYSVGGSSRSSQRGGYRGLGGRESQHGGSNFGGNQRGGRGRRGYRGGGGGARREVDPNAEFEAMMADSHATYGFHT